MEKMFGPAYTGDPGVPHMEKDVFNTLVKGCLAFSVYTAFDPYHWQLATYYNYHDWAMVCDNHRMKVAMKKKEPFKSLWNAHMSEGARRTHYHVWQDYFP